MDATRCWYVCQCPLRTRWHVLTDPLSDSLTVLKARRSQSKTRRSPHVTLARLVTRTSLGPSPSQTKTSGALHIHFPPSPPSPFSLPHTTPPPLTETPRLPHASTTQDPSRSTKRSSTCPTAPRSAHGTKRCTPRWRPSSTTTREGASRRFRRTGNLNRRVGSSLDTMRTRRSSGGGPPADVSVSKRLLGMATSVAAAPAKSRLKPEPQSAPIQAEPSHRWSSRHFSRLPLSQLTAC